MHKFTLCAAADLTKDSLPRAHACICTIDLPEYSSFAVLRRALHTAAWRWRVTQLLGLRNNE